jgi:hypothetical protein
VNDPLLAYVDGQLITIPPDIAERWRSEQQKWADELPGKMRAMKERMALQRDHLTDAIHRALAP